MSINNLFNGVLKCWVCSMLIWPVLVSASDNISARETNALVTGVIKFSAHITIPIAEILASEPAALELYKFRTGEHDGMPEVYPLGSDATQEILGSNYYHELTQHLIAAMSRWYGGEIPYSGALYYDSDGFRVFDGSDAFPGLMNGLDMGDIIGSFTYYVRMTSDAGLINFTAINVMSLGSYAGENYFQHKLVANPKEGAFKSRIQVFQWQAIIPAELMTQ